MKNISNFSQFTLSFFIALSLLAFSIQGECQTVGKSLHFDGENDFVQLSGTNDFGAASNFQGAFTFEAWVLNDGTSNWGRVFDFGNNTNQYIFFTPKSSTGKPRFVLKIAGQNENIIQAPNSFPEGWTHVACRIDETGNAALLFDGVVVETATGWPLISNMNSVTNSYLGKSQFSADPYFKGNLKEVRIWKEARTTSQINQWMNCEVSGQENNLVAYMKMKQGIVGANNSATDAYVNNFGALSVYAFATYNFSMSGSTSNWVADQPNSIDDDPLHQNVIEFYGTPDYIDLNNEANFDFDEEYTIQYWLKNTTSLNLLQLVLTKGDINGTLSFYSDFNNNTLFFGQRSPGEGSFYIIANGLPTDQWTHITLTAKEEYGGITFKTYFNGELKANGFKPNSQIPQTNQKVRLGAGEFYGTLSNVKFWDRALKIDEIQQNISTIHPDGTPNLIAQYTQYDNNILTGLIDNIGDNNGIRAGVPSFQVDPCFVQFSQEPQDVTLPNLSTPIILTADIETCDNTYHSYQWQFDGVDIPGETSLTYTNPSPTNSDLGKYRCVVTACGKEFATRNAAITINNQGKVLHFDGEDDYISFNDNVGESFYTAEMWLRFDEQPYNQNIITRTNADKSTVYSHLAVSEDGYFQHNSYDNYYLETQSIKHPLKIVPHKWYHVAIRHFGAGDGINGSITIEVDGVASPQENAGTLSGAPIWNVGGSFYEYNNFKGEMEELRIWNYPTNTMGQTEITSASNGLKHYYKFNEGIANADNTSPVPVNTMTDHFTNQVATLHNFNLTSNTSNWLGCGPTEIVPTINGLADQLISIGNPFQINPSISSLNGDEVFQWYKDGEPIVGANGLTFAIENSQIEDEGSYQLEVRPLNSCNYFSDEVDIYIQGTGEVLNLSGDNDYIRIPTETPTAYTIEAWVKFEESTALQSIIVSTTNLGPFHSYTNQLFTDEFGYVVHRVYDPISTNTIVKKSLQPLNSNEWYHIVGRASTGNGVDLLINGISQGPESSISGLVTESNVWIVGGKSLGGTSGVQLALNGFKGEIDELRIWNYYVSTPNILLEKDHEIENLGLPGLVHYYKFNSGRANENNSFLNRGYLKNYKNLLSTPIKSYVDFVNFSFEGDESNFSDCSPITEYDLFYTLDGLTPTIGQPLNFNLNVYTGDTSALNFVWRLDSVAIPGATNALYGLDNMTASDFGQYDVVISDACSPQFVDTVQVFSSPTTINCYTQNFNSTNYPDSTTYVFCNNSEIGSEICNETNVEYNLTGGYCGGPSLHNGTAVVFHLPLSEPQVVDFTLTGIETTVDLFIMSSDCDIDNCIASSTNDFTQDEFIRVALDTGDYYIIAHEREFFDFEGSDSLVLEIQMYDNKCSFSEPITCGDSVQSNTSTGSNFINEYCNNTTYTSSEKIYEVIVTEPTTFTALLSNMTADLDLFLLDSLCNDVVCLASSTQQDGINETIIYGVPPGTYYFSIDGKNGVTGDFDFSLNCAPYFTASVDETDAWIDLSWSIDKKACVPQDTGIIVRLITTPNTILYEEEYPTAALTPDVITGTFRHLVGDNHNRNYVLRVSNRLSSKTICNEVKAGSTLPFQSPEILSVSQSVSPDSIEIIWRNHSQLSDEFRIYRDGAQITSLSEGYIEDSLIISYVDKHNMNDNSSIYQNELHSYCIETYNATLGLSYPQVCADGSTYDVDFTASDGTPSDMVSLTWNDVSSFCDGILIRRNGIQLELISPLETFYNDLDPIRGVISEYELALLKNGEEFIRISDNGYSLPDGAVSGRVVTNEGGYPVQNALITLTKDTLIQGVVEQVNVATTNTDFAGTFNFQDIIYELSSDFTISASKPGSTFSPGSIGFELNAALPTQSNLLFTDNSDVIVNLDTTILNSLTIQTKTNEDLVVLNWQYVPSGSMTTYFTIQRNGELIFEGNDALNVIDSFVDYSGVPGFNYNYTLELFRFEGNEIKSDVHSKSATYPQLTPLSGWDYNLEGQYQFSTNQNVDPSILFDWSNYNHPSENFDGFRIFRNNILIGEVAKDSSQSYFYIGIPNMEAGYKIRTFKKINGATYESTPYPSTDSLITTYPIWKPAIVSEAFNSDRAIILDLDLLMTPYEFYKDAVFTGVSVERKPQNASDSLYEEIGVLTKDFIAAQAEMDAQPLVWDAFGIPNEAYTYRVSTYLVLAGQKYTRDTIFDRTCPEIEGPTNLAKTEAVGQVTLSWTDNGIETGGSSELYINYQGYELTRRDITNGGTTDIIAELAAGVNTYDDFLSNPVFNLFFDEYISTNYEYTLRAYFDIDTTRYYSQPLSINAKPLDGAVEEPIPTNFMASKDIPGHIKLCWDWTPTKPSEFIVYRDTLPLDTVPSDGRAYYDYDVPEDPTVLYKLTSLFNGVESQPALAIGRMPLNTQIHGRIANINSGAGIEGCTVYYRNQSNASLGLSFSQYEGTTTTDGTGYYSFDDIPKIPGVVYQINVFRNNADFNASENQYQSATQKFVATGTENSYRVDFTEYSDVNAEEEVSPIYFVTATPDTDSMFVKLRWSPIHGNYDGFQVYRANQLLGELRNGEGFEFNDINGFPGILYTYSVRAYKNEIDGRKFSKKVAAQAEYPRILPVENLTVTAFSEQNKMLVSWSHPLDNHDFYRIRRNGAFMANVSTGESLMWYDSTGIPGLEYQYEVAAVKGANISALVTVNKAFKGVGEVQDLSAEIDGFVQACSYALTNDNHVTILWQYDPLAANGFEIYRDGDLIAEIQGLTLAYGNGPLTTGDTLVNGNMISYDDFEGIPGIQHTYHILPYVIREGDRYTSGIEELFPTVATVFPDIAEVLRLDVAQNNELGSVQIDFDYAPSIVDGFEIIRDGIVIDTLLESDGLLIDTLSGGNEIHYTYQDFDGIPGDLLTYSVRAFDRRSTTIYYGENTCEEEVEFPVVPIPQNLVVSQGVYENHIELNWNFPFQGLVDSFYLENITLEVTHVIAPGKRTFFDIVNSFEEASYEYRIRASRITNGQELFSDWSTIESGWCTRQINGEEIVQMDGSLQSTFNGWSLDIDNDWAVSGAPDGHEQINIYKRINGGWNLFQTILSPFPSSDIDFGHAVAISGDYIIVGAPEYGNGIVVLYEFDGSQWGNPKYLYSPGPGNYGWSVDIDGDDVIVGNPYWDNGAGVPYGAIYWYKRNADGLWVNKGSQTGNGQLNYTDVRRFGYGVAIKNNYSVATWNRPSANYSEGVTYVLNSNEDWVFNQYLSTGIYTYNQYLTYDNVDVDDNVVVLGDRVYNNNSGRVIVVNLQNNLYTNVTQIYGNNGNTSFFGESVAVSKIPSPINDHTYIAIGSSIANTNGLPSTGRAHLYSNISGSFVEIDQIVNDTPAAYDHNGQSVAISKDCWASGIPRDGIINTGKVIIENLLIAPLSVDATDGISSSFDPTKTTISWQFSGNTDLLAGFNIYRNDEFLTYRDKSTAIQISPEIIADSWDDNSGTPGQSFVYTVKSVNNLIPYESYGTSDEGFRSADGIIRGAVKTQLGLVPIPGVTITAEGIVDGEIYTYTTTTLSNGQYTFNDIYYSSNPLDVTEYTISAEYLDHVIIPQTTNIAVMNPLNEPTQDVIDFFDITAYVIKGIVTQPDVNCPIEGIKITAIQNDIPLIGQEAYTDENGNYSLVINPNEENLQEIRIRIEQSLEEEQVVTTYNFVPMGDTVFTDFVNFPIETELNFEDHLTYDVNLQVKNTCVEPISTSKWNVRIRTLDGCFDEVYQTNVNGDLTVPLIPLNYKMSVVGVDNPSAINQQALDYFANFPVTLNLLDTHRDSIETLSKLEIEELSERSFIFHKAPSIDVDGLDDIICNTQTAILEQGATYGLTINITETHNGNECPVQEGLLRISNPASSDDGPIIIAYDEFTQSFPTYTFTAGGPNAIFPHAYAITFDYLSDDGIFLGRATKAAFVEGSIAIPGTDIIVDPASGNDAIPYPLMVLRDPPGDQSSSYIAAEQTISFTTEMAVSNEFDGSVYSELSTEIFSIGIDVNSSINGGYNNEQGITLENTVTTTTQISTSDDEDNIGRDADIIVGTGIVMQYGLIKEFKVGECDEIVIIKKYGISPNAATTTWSYQISQVEEIIQGYVNDSIRMEEGTLVIERNGEPLSTTEARTFLSTNIDNWKQVIDYHDVKTVPYYVLCTLNPANIPFSDSHKQQIGYWQAQLRPFFGSFINGEFVLNDEIIWDQQLINAYNAGSSAIRNLLQGGDLSIWSFPYVGGDNTIDLNVPLLDFDLVDLASILNTPSLTDYTDNFGDQVKNITTGGNILIEESINNAQASETSITNSVYMGTELDVAGSVGGDVTLQTGGFAGLGAGVIFGKVTQVTSSEFTLGAKFETTFTRSNSYASTIEESVEVGYSIFDDDNADAFSFAIIQGVAPNMTPYFDYFGGHSSCPPEDGSIFVDAPKIAILDLESGGTSQTKEYFNVPPEEAATFYVIVENQSPIASEPSRELEVYLESGSNDNGAIITINGVSLNNSTYIDSFDVGAPDTLILTIERGPTFYDYPDIQIGFEPTCGEGPREYIYASAYFSNPCSPVTLVAPNENWVINDDTTKLVVAMQDYDPENPFLVDATLQYRRLGTGQDWTDVNGLQLEKGNYIPADSLAANDAEYAEGQIPKYFFIWSIPTTEGLFPDGDYEVRVSMVCDNFSSTISNVISGKIARNGLNLFGTPQPADQIWTSGDEISFSFNKDLDCALITESFVNNNISVFNETTATEEPFALSCYGNKLIFIMDNPMSDYDGQFLTLHVDNIPSLEGNISLPHAWTFRVITQKIYWADADTVKLRMYQDQVETLNLQLENSTLNESISGLTFVADDGGFDDWIVITDPATQPFAVNPSGRTITFEIDAAQPVGIYNETINVMGVEAFGNTPKVHIQLEVLVKPPNWVVNSSDFATSMNMIANWKYTTDEAGTISTDEADLISVWVGNEIRGVAPITETGEFHASYLTIYGQLEDGDSTALEFRIWDADLGLEFDGQPAETIFYISNSTRGTTANPEILEVNADYDQAKYIYLRQGWTGFSLTDSTINMNLQHKLRTLKNVSDGDLIVTGDKFSQYTDSLGWFNFGVSNLAILDNDEGYMVYLENGPDTLRVTGTASFGGDLVLKSGWNWIGFPFENPESINTALNLNSANATGNDRIKVDFPLPGDVAKFANYNIGSDNWNDGNIDNLEPNNLYKLYSGHPNGAILSWNTPNNLKGEKIENEGIRSSPVVDPNDAGTWVMPEFATDEVMPIIAEVIVNGIVANDPADKVAFFENDTIRALASIEYLSSLNAYELSLLAEKSAGSFDIRYYDASEGVVLTSSNVLNFDGNGVGTIFDPYEIIFDEDPCPNTLLIGPNGNPFALNKTFEASQEIRVLGTLTIPENVQIILSAPKVTIVDQLNPLSGATIIVRPDGCE
ncbi:MAG: hypothetical protein P1U56_07915 [Saprospiraceae bacterium]|nr:hypothetical protein [Saprospiraceae bacterium]